MCLFSDSLYFPLDFVLNCQYQNKESDGSCNCVRCSDFPSTMVFLLDDFPSTMVFLLDDFPSTMVFLLDDFPSTMVFLLDDFLLYYGISIG